MAKKRDMKTMARAAARILRDGLWLVYCVDCDPDHQRPLELDGVEMDPSTGDILTPCPKCGTVGSLIEVHHG